MDTAAPRIPSNPEDLALIEALRRENAELRAKLEAVLLAHQNLERKLHELEKRITGRTTEKKKSPRQDKAPPRKPNDEQAQVERNRRRDEQSKLPTEAVEHELEEAARTQCAECGSDHVELVEPAVSHEYEYIPGRFVRREHRQQTVMCRDCKHFERAPAPARVWDQARYGPGLIAHTLVSKCADCIPLHRQAKRFEREGVPMSRSTLADLFHRAVGLLAPLYERMVALLPGQRIVHADETSLKMQRVEKLGYVWTFACELCVIYVYSADRSGQTPARILGESQGTLIVDAYTGYNEVSTPNRRTRGGCNVHGRRKFIELDDPVSVEIVQLYGEVFEVERLAREGDFVGSARHQELRQQRSAPAMAKILSLARSTRERVAPKSPLGRACGYIINQYEALTLFLRDIEVCPHNNLSERLLRVIALGRRNYLFVGHEQAGQHLAMACSLIATCELHGVNPQAYLADVLMRVQTHPASRLEELLPHRWSELVAAEA